jgi:hypothetical protein
MAACGTIQGVTSNTAVKSEDTRSVEAQEERTKGDRKRNEAKHIFLGGKRERETEREGKV